MTTIHNGLEGVVVAETTISDVQGIKGTLIVRGYSVEELAEVSPFESTALLLWGTGLPSKGDEQAMVEALGKARASVYGKIVRLLEAIPLPGSPLEFQRAALSVLSSPGTTSFAEQRLEVTAALAVAAAVWHRAKHALTPVSPDASLTQSADLLHMLSGNRPSAAQIQGLDRYLTTVADHGMNASTFAVRVVASTGSDLLSAVAAGLGALKGPLHGGAPGPVLDMLDAIGKPENASAWIDRELSLGHRIMGMGHRIYKVRDPRAAVLERALLRLEGLNLAGKRLPLARAVEAVAQSSLRKKYPGRELHANVEFYTAVLLDALKVPRDVFTALFGVGRVLGWCAHFGEQEETGRLIRPESLYVGK